MDQEIKKTKLRGKKPSDAEKSKRFKAFFYGPAGVGKTMTSIGFPKPYLIDTEKGAENSQYCKILNDNGGSIFQTSEFEELVKEVKILLSEKHDYKTLIIDPLTTIYNDLLDKSASSVGVEFGRHYGEANKHMKKLISLLLKLDMNVIITSHAKNEYGDGMKVIGSTFDCYKKLDYLFDLVLDIQKHGEKRIGMIKKSRIESFKENEHFNFSYESISEKYNKDVMERDSVPFVLATEEQISNIKHLIEAMNISSLVYSQWLSKEECESFEEMRSESIQKCIDHLNKKVNNTTKDK